jgi:fused signal recognition particle receptor
MSDSTENTEKTNKSGSALGRFFKRKKAVSGQDQAVSGQDQAISGQSENVEIAAQGKEIDEGLAPSRQSFFGKVSSLFQGTFDLDDELFEELEEVLISSDMGVPASLKIVDQLRERVSNERIKDAAGVMRGLKAEIALELSPAEQAWQLEKKPYVILMVGVNGVGKTTTTAKIAHKLQQSGKKVMLAAADTFRAAAVEQLQTWGERLDIPVIAQAQGSDAAAVAHDALSAAKARDIDVLLIDTAGRLHTQSDLMEQLQKVNRVLQKIDPDTPHEVMQILDATTGQNALNQLEHFQKAVSVSSVCLTKLDGSARGGVAVSLTEKFKLPIRFIGIGESFADLREFNAADFAEAIVPKQAS